MLFPTPAAGFDDPLGVLADCHGRIDTFCGILDRLRAHLRTAGADAEARDAARRVFAYFDHAAPHHHADEEVDLLPLLSRRAGTAAERTLVMVWEQRVSAEHLAQDTAWQKLRQELLAVMDARGTDLTCAEAFVALEREHLHFEDAEILPLARVLLGPEDLAVLGRAMALRRGIDGP